MAEHQHKMPHQPGTKPGDWTEDFAHENGNYMCRCCHCGSIFYGHKRRVSCKMCSSGSAGNAGVRGNEGEQP